MSFDHLRRAMRATTPTPTARLVLIYLADYASDAGEAWPSVPTLAARTSLSPRTVRDALRRLEAEGLIRTTERRGRNTSNLYTLTLDGASKPAGDAAPDGKPAGAAAQTGRSCRSKPAGAAANPLKGTYQGTSHSYRSYAAVSHSDASVAERAGPLPREGHDGGGGASGGRRDCAKKRPRTGRHEIEALVGADLVAAFEAQASRSYSDAAWREMSTQLADADCPVAAMVDAIARGADWPSAHAPPSIEADATPLPSARPQSSNGRVCAADWNNIRGAQ